MRIAGSSVKGRKSWEDIAVRGAIRAYRRYEASVPATLLIGMFLVHMYNIHTYIYICIHIYTCICVHACARTYREQCRIDGLGF